MKPLTMIGAFTATDVLQKALTKHYSQQGFEESVAKKHAYSNTLPFLHRFLQGQRLLDGSLNATVHIQPLMLYYSFTEFLKAIILFYDPTYPSTTSVLAHGVSTRKRKRKDYRFIDDEVKVQRHGLFPLLSDQMFHVKLDEGERFKMADLFLQLQAMNTVTRYDARLEQKRDSPKALPPLLVHYLLLYNLSMISRYETEWWGELIANRISSDLPLIEHYLHTVPNSISQLIAEEALVHLG